MTTDSCFILCAGFGSRMGEIGKVLPKPLWPLFGQTLLSATINFWQSLGVENFYINVHHHQKLLRDYILSLDAKITILEEEALLGSGGAFHNLKKLNPELGHVYATNCDAFALDIDEKVLREISKRKSITLFSTPVKKGEKFNRLILERGLLKGIKKKFDEDGVTYSGSCLIDLDKLSECPGVSGFFESVANYESKEVFVEEKTIGKLLDFGTAENYYKSSFSLLNGSLEFKSLISRCKLKPREFKNVSNIDYSAVATREDQRVNTTTPKFVNSILLKMQCGTSPQREKESKAFLVYNEIIQSVESTK